MADVAPTITTVGSLPQARVGVAYTFTFTATGTPTPTWAITAGTLPTGLTLSAAGVLSGTPTAAGTAAVTVTATGLAPADTLDVSIEVVANTLANVADLAAHLNETIPAGATTSAQQAIDAAVATVQLWSGRTLVPTRETVTVTGWSQVVPLPDGPVTTVHSVTVGGVARDDWTLDPDGQLLFTGAIPLASAVVVDFEHGFPVGSRQWHAARLLVLREAERIFNNPRNRTSYNGPGPDGYSFVTDMSSRIMTPDEQALLSLIARPGGF